MKKTDSNYILEIDQQRYEISPETIAEMAIQQENDTTFKIESEGQSFEIKLEKFDLPSGRLMISIDGHTRGIKIIREIEVMIEKMGLNASHSKKHSLVSAPMPGLVTEIKVTAGQQVDKGTPLMILEAMKMENVIAAPHEAVIKTILVPVGHAVEKGLPL